jgi:DNA-binding NtrC family response regulator
MLMMDIEVLSEGQYRLDFFGADGPTATSTRRSLLEHRTTLLIKHIDRAHGYVQEWLGEALSSGCVTRRGARGARPVVCRTIFAFPASPRKLSRSGRLERSLSALLESYTTVQIPPLSQRAEDIPALAGALLSECLEETIGPELRAREWSDNVAGLRAYLWSLVVKSHAEVERSREREELQKILKLVAEGREFSLKESLAHIEEAIVERALARSRGNQAKAARLLGLTDRTIRRQLHKIV